MKQHWPKGIPAREAEQIREICRLAREKGLLAGFNGNASMRIGETALITRSGTAKGMLRHDDLSLVRLHDSRILHGRAPSSEYPLHAAMYAAQPAALSILHTHPPKLLAIAAMLPREERLILPVFEAKPLREQMAWAGEHPPGTPELAQAAAECSREYKAIWLERHGLAAWGENLVEALALSEELEHLAGIQLMLAQHGR